jgi:hypothetical protein
MNNSLLFANNAKIYYLQIFQQKCTVKSESTFPSCVYASRLFLTLQPQQHKVFPDVAIVHY